jgi:putative membrane protein
MRKTAYAGLATLALTLVAAAPSQTSSRTASPGDADATAFGIAVDSGEMMLADLAISKKPTDEFMNYVTDLREDHKEHLSALISEAKKANVTVGMPAFVDSLKSKAMDVHNKVMGKTGADFEKAFLDEMIAGHTDALNTLNMRIMTQELSEGVKKEMDHLKRMVEEHLSKAKVLRNG